MDFDALDAGTAYALFRHGQDVQTEDLARILREPRQVQVHLTDDDPDIRGEAPEPLDFSTVVMPESWDEYIGQEPLKRQMSVYISQAIKQGTRLPHTLFASGVAGVGKTTAARLTAKMLGVEIIELVPPFNVYTLAQAAEQLNDRDILFIDEIHGLANNGKKGAEILLKALEDAVIHLPNGEVVYLNDITFIGATTDRDKLPEPVIDRFKIKPYFQPYSIPDLAQIAAVFVGKHNAFTAVDSDLGVAMARACRGVPRVIEEMVMAANAIEVTLGTGPTPEQLLGFLEVEPDGLTRTHIHYLTALRQLFKRTLRDGTVEYVTGEGTMLNLLRETKQGIGRVERYLTEQGMIDRSPRGRRLTALGLARAEQLIAAGKGL